MTDISDFIRKCGGPTQLGRQIGRSQQSVSSWVNNGIPARHIGRLHELTGIPYDQLFELTKSPKDRAA